jgi:hypothetical protein
MKILIKISNGHQSCLIDVTDEVSDDTIKTVKSIKFKECELETYSDHFVYSWLDLYLEQPNKPFWIAQCDRLLFEVIVL